MNEHPELYKPKPKAKPSKGERAILEEKQRIEAKEQARRAADGMPRIIDRTKRLPKATPD